MKRQVWVIEYAIPDASNNPIRWRFGAPLVRVLDEQIIETKLREEYGEAIMTRTVSYEPREPS